MFRLTLNRVYDRIEVKEGDERLVLVVDEDARRIVSKIRNAQEKLVQANDGTDDERANAARMFSEAMFGEKQTQNLVDFYHGDYSCVITICGMYFEKRLSKKILSAQKRIK